MKNHFKLNAIMEQILSPRFMQDRHQHRTEHMAAIRQRIQSHTAQALSAEEEHDLLHMREELKSVWEQTNLNADQLRLKLQDWCRRAEDSGLAPLRELSLRLRRYTPTA